MRDGIEKYICNCWNYVENNWNWKQSAMEEKSPLPSSMLKMKILCLFHISIKKRLVKVNVMVLTKMHDSVRVITDKRWKPDFHVLYDHAKGDVDVVDLSSSHHSTRMKRKT